MHQNTTGIATEAEAEVDYPLQTSLINMMNYCDTRAGIRITKATIKQLSTIITYYCIVQARTRSKPSEQAYGQR